MEFEERPVLLLIKSRPFGTIINFEGWRASVGMFGMDHEPTMLFMGDGVYAVLKNIDDMPIRMFKATFKSFEGKICVSKKSLEERNISPDEIVGDAEIIDEDAIAEAFIENDIIVTF
ncbi:MAG: DsrE family protein [Candidatus Thorarchaeota archaeon]|nr:DsrE family protein [Candidatus Thorarchaeota archaeon]MCK5239187.1 DsrE family protein [Candidatus Thorarchaeota archaeon]